MRREVKRVAVMFVAAVLKFSCFVAVAVVKYECMPCLNIFETDMAQSILATTSTQFVNARSYIIKVNATPHNEGLVERQYVDETVEPEKDENDQGERRKSG